jgi:hypothetical protein
MHGPKRRLQMGGGVGLSRWAKTGLIPDRFRAHGLLICQCAPWEGNYRQVGQEKMGNHLLPILARRIDFNSRQGLAANRNNVRIGGRSTARSAR